jgi:hypothetical protein
MLKFLTFHSHSDISFCKETFTTQNTEPSELSKQYFTLTEWRKQAPLLFSSRLRTSAQGQLHGQPDLDGLRQQDFQLHDQLSGGNLLPQRRNSRAPGIFVTDEFDFVVDFTARHGENDEHVFLDTVLKNMSFTVFKSIFIYLFKL